MKKIITFIFCCILLPVSSAEANTDCNGPSEGHFSDVSIERIFEIFDLNGIDGQSISELLHQEENSYFPHPISQILIALRFVEDEQFESALGHLDLATYVARRYQLCNRELIEEISLIIRKRALENILSENLPSRPLYYSLTEGMLLPKLGLFSQQFSELKECIGEQMFVSSETQGVCR